MKRFLMLVAVATVAGAMYVAAAPGSQQSTPTARQFTALKKQVAKLSKSLNALKKDEGKVKSGAVEAETFLASCFVSAGAVGVGQFGDANGAFGFKYTTDGINETRRTALDVDTSAAPQALLQAVSPTCISSSNSAEHALHSSSTRVPVRAERAH